MGCGFILSIHLDRTVSIVCLVVKGVVWFLSLSAQVSSDFKSEEERSFVALHSRFNWSLHSFPAAASSLSFSSAVHSPTHFLSSKFVHSPFPNFSSVWAAGRFFCFISSAHALREGRPCFFLYHLIKSHKLILKLIWGI